MTAGAGFVISRHFPRSRPVCRQQGHAAGKRVGSGYVPGEWYIAAEAGPRGAERSSGAPAMAQIRFRAVLVLFLLPLPGMRGWSGVPLSVRAPGEHAAYWHGQNRCPALPVMASPGWSDPPAGRGAGGRLPPFPFRRSLSPAGIPLLDPLAQEAQSRDTKPQRWIVSLNPGLVSNSLHDFHRNSTALLRGLRNFTNSGIAAQHVGPIGSAGSKRALSRATLPQCVIHSRLQRLIDRELANHAAVDRQLGCADRKP